MIREPTFAAKEQEIKSISVWDPFIRVAHWLLVVAFVTAYLTGEQESGAPDPLHVWSGYVIAGLIALRIIWGVVGPQHARFVDFVHGPRAVADYLLDLMRGRARRYIGHSPAGGAMIIALLILLAGTVGTGLVAYGERGLGPLATGSAGVSALTPSARFRHEASGPNEAEAGESAIAELHGVLANITLLLVTFHVLGVVVASVVHRENLVTAMITGKKRSAS